MANETRAMLTASTATREKLLFGGRAGNGILQD